MSDPHTIVLHRTINAPREKVWAACTEEELLAKWWGQPNGAVMPYFHLDFTVGGSFHFMIELPDESVLWGKSIYREIVASECLVFDEYFSDEKGELLDTEDMPKSLITLTFAADGAKTLLTVRHEGLGIEPQSIEAHEEEWGESLDRLVGAVQHS